MTQPGDRSGTPAPPTFARLAAAACAPCDQLLLAAAGELGPVDRHNALDRLDDLARGVFGIAAAPAEEAAGRLVGALAQDAGLTVGGATPDSLLLDRVLARRTGHPILLAAVYREVARRAGLEATLLSSGEHWFVGIGNDATEALLAMAPVDDAIETLEVRRRCAHETTDAALRELSRVYRATGQDRQAIRAVALRRLFPFAPNLKQMLTEEDDA